MKEPRLSVLATGLGVALGLAALITRAAAAETRDEAIKKAQRATSYVLLAETVARTSIQAGGMLDRQPFDKAIAFYARGLGRLHVQLFEKLTPPEGTEGLHKQVKEAVDEFALCTEAHYNADYPTARKHRERCVKEFLQALGALAKLKHEGVIPSISHDVGGK
jgi:hypothetical protein